MSGTHLLRSWRGRLPLLATFMILIALVVVAPSVSARAAVKQFKASVSPTTAVGQTSGTWTETIQNCGSASTAPCTASSTIGLGTVRIAVPTDFRPITSVTASSPQLRNWTVSYDSVAGAINAYATTGSDKLQPGEALNITFSATPSTCTGTGTFTTSAWGSTPIPGSDPFTIQTAQPAVTISGCALAAGDSVTDPTGTQTETVDGDFTGTLNVAFGGNLMCSSDAQWAAGYQLPYQVTITPGPGFVAGSGPKISTSTFDPTVAGDSSIAGDSSWYRICYLGPNETTGHILDPCYAGGGVVNAPPCVDQQERIFGTNLIRITILLPKDDPAKH
jgi:hypothetical protein